MINKINEVTNTKTDLELQYQELMYEISKLQSDIAEKQVDNKVFNERL